MTLMDRAEQARSALVSHVQPESESALEYLKERVQLRLHPAKLAQSIKENPVQARNEIRAVCDAVIKENPWAFRGVNREHLIGDYLDLVFGFGPLENLLGDESITEIMVNGTRSLFYEREGVLYQANEVFIHDEQVYSLIDKIVSPLGRRVDESSPMVNARLPEGYRVNVVIPPLALDGPTVTIRKFRKKVFSLQELAELEAFDSRVHTLLQWAVRRRCNIAVSGGTGSGKTTLLNALSCEIPTRERIITIEDSAELRFGEHPHVVRLESRMKNAEGVGEVSIKDLVINALRMRPDRIVVGECRGAEALDMLQAMNTGHDGSLTTLHANSPLEAISRLTMMVRYGANLPIEVIEAQVASAIDVVVQMAREPGGRRYVSEIVGYRYDFAAKTCEIDTYYRVDRVTKERKWESYPAWVNDLPYLGITQKEEVERWKSEISLLD